MNNSSNQMSAGAQGLAQGATEQASTIQELSAAVQFLKTAAGKGFAVVADEVRNLAGKSADSANQIAKLIQSTIDAVKDGVNIANVTAESLNETTANMEGIMNEISKITDSYQKAAAELGGIATGIDQVSAVVQTNSATAEESAATAEELNGQVELMKHLVDTFTLEDMDLEKMQTYDYADNVVRASVMNAGSANNFDKY